MNAGIAIGFVIVSIGLSGIFYALGRLHERLAWNALIEKGVIPKPRR